MQDTDVLDRHWRDEGLSHPFHRALTFTQAGLVLGRGTLLAEFEKERLAARGLSLDGHEARVVSLLTAAHGEPVAEGVIAKIRRAGEFWCGGEKTLAQIHLAFIGLPKLDETDAYRLFLAGVALEKGLEPRDLMKAMGFPRAARAIEKYSEDQPRVPAGSGRESGEWTNGAGANTFVPAPPLTGHRLTLSDISPEPAGPTWQVAQSVKVKDVPDGTPVSPYGEKAVSFNNLPQNARQILQFRGFVQNDVTGEWYVGLDLPPDSEARFTVRVRGQDAGIADSGYVIAPPGSPALPPEGSNKEPKSGLRYGDWNPYTGEAYFKVFNYEGQPISPVTGRTADKDAPTVHYPVDPVMFWFGHWFGGWFGGP